MINNKFSTQEGSNQNTRFLNAKDHTPPETKVNHKLPPTKVNQIKRQTQSKAPTPPEDQMSLDKPQDTHKPLNQQNKSIHK
jgi:hypothetical protein